MRSYPCYNPESVLLQFPQVLRDVWQYQSTMGCPTSRLGHLTTKLTTAFSEASSHTVLKEHAAWQRTTRQFLANLESRYPCYLDILLPYMAGVQSLMAGLQWMAKAVEVTCEKGQLFLGMQEVSF